MVGRQGSGGPGGLLRLRPAEREVQRHHPPIGDARFPNVGNDTSAPGRSQSRLMTAGANHHFSLSRRYAARCGGAGHVARRVSVRRGNANAARRTVLRSSRCFRGYREASGVRARAPACSRCLPPPLPRPRSSINRMLSARRAGGSSSAYLTSAGRGQWLFPDDARSLELGAVIDMATDARAVSGDSGSAFAAPARTRGDLARAARGSSTATRVAWRSRTSPSTPRGHARRLAPDVEHGDALDGGRCTAGWRPGKLL